MTTMQNDDQEFDTPYKPGDLLSGKEAASYLRLSEGTLRNQRANGQGPAFVRVGPRTVRYRFADLQSLITASTAGAA